MSTQPAESLPPGGQPDPSGRDAAASLMAAVLIAIAIAAVWSHSTPPRESATYTPVSPSWLPSDALRAQWAKEEDHLTALPAQADDAAMREALSALGRAEVATPPDSPTEELRRAQTEAERVATRYMARHGLDAYRALGKKLERELVQAWRQAMLDVRKGRATLPRRPATASSPGPERTLQELGGRLLEEGIRLGLVRHGGSESHGARWIVRLGFEMRWLMLIRELVPVDSSMPPSRRGTLDAWKAEAHPVLPVERRLELIERAAALVPDYRAWKARGAVHAAAGNWGEAAHAFESALADDPQDSEVEAALAAIARRSSK